MILVCRYFFFPAFAVAVAFRKLPETNLGSIKIKKNSKATTPKQKNSYFNKYSRYVTWVTY